jgi:hypothetical protein
METKKFIVNFIYCSSKRVPLSIIVYMSTDNTLLALKEQISHIAEVAHHKF